MISFTITNTNQKNNQMKKAISYSLFGFNKARHKDCFDFHSYLRGLMINVRMNRLLFPDWVIVLHVDQVSYDAYQYLLDNIGVEIRIESEAPLCEAMLWRMKTIYEYEHPNWLYSHVICRDLDSPPTYREAQAVQQWVDNDKTMHAITDSVSHCVFLLGGMIGARPDYFTGRVAKTYEKLLSLGTFDFRRKGSDQDFLNQVVYPKVSQPTNESITQHYFNGMGQTHLNDYHNCLCSPVVGHSDDCQLNIKLDIDPALKASNEVCGHIGAAGYYEGAMFKFLREYWHQFDDLLEIEKSYPKIFYWIN